MPAAHNIAYGLQRALRKVTRHSLYTSRAVLVLEEALLADPRRALLLEYPKCGRSWLRYMICQAEALVCNRPLRNSLAGVWSRRDALPRVHYAHGFPRTPGDALPTSRTPPLTLETFTRRGYKRFVFLVREPERVMASYYHHCTHRAHLFEGSASEFIRSPDFGIDNYVSYVEGYLEQLDRVPSQILTYERLRADTRGELSALLTFLNLPLDPDAVSAIVENSTLDRMRSDEENDRFPVSWLCNKTGDPRARKIRSGGSEPLTSLFSTEDLTYMRNIYGRSRSFADLGYLPHTEIFSASPTPSLE